MNRFPWLLPYVIVLMLLPFAGRAQQIPLLNAFAHNDYQHKYPFFDAIDNGYTNIEADVFAYKGRLVVAHIFPQLNNKRNLEDLYLQPIAKYLSEHNGEIYSGYTEPFTLMVDIKSNADKTYLLLKPLLEKYRSILWGYQNGQLNAGPVRVVLSGHKPYQQLQGDQNRLAFIDEDLRRIKQDTAMAAMFSMASCKYSKLLKWKGTGNISQADQKKLRTYVDEAHRCGAKVRLWASPDKPVVWQKLMACGVDLIGTDKLVRLRNFLVKEKETEGK